MKNLPDPLELAWDSAGVKPMLEYYLGQRLSVIEEEFQQFIRQISLEVLDS